MAFDVDRLMVYMIEASREISNKAKFTILRDARGICNLARGAAYTVNTYFVPDGWTEKELAYYIVTVYDFFMYYTHGVNDKGKIFLSHKLDDHTPFQWIETIGVPIDLMLSIFYLCAKREINWDQFVAEARKAKWKPKTIIDKVTYGVRDAITF
jgi:hypothetical protein